jgi:hypothetical protein
MRESSARSWRRSLTKIGENRRFKMEITDYDIIEGGEREELVRRVKAAALQGWEILGIPQRAAGGDYWWQGMAKKFNPHEGEVWVKQRGFPGRWEKVM